MSFVLFIHDENFKILDISPLSSANLFNLKPERVMGMSWLDGVSGKTMDQLISKAKGLGYKQKDGYLSRQSIVFDPHCNSDPGEIISVTFKRMIGSKAFFFCIGFHSEVKENDAKHGLLRIPGRDKKNIPTCIAGKYAIIWLAMYMRVVSVYAKHFHVLWDVIAGPEPVKSLKRWLTFQRVHCEKIPGFNHAQATMNWGIERCSNGVNCDKIIFYDPDLPYAEKMMALLHEAAHCLLGHVDCKSECEFYYDSLANEAMAYFEAEAEMLASMMLFHSRTMLNFAASGMLCATSLMHTIPGWKEVVSNEYHLNAMHDLCDQRINIWNTSINYIHFLRRQQIGHLMPDMAHSVYAYQSKIRKTKAIRRIYQ